MNVLFIHRSVGRNLIHEGGLRELLKAHGIALDDYDNNTGTLTHADGSITNNVIKIPGDNTNPDNLAAYFSGWDSFLDKYDAVMVKSCYPNSHVKNAAQLEAIKKQYTAIFETFGVHGKRLLLLTSPPLRPLFTNRREAELASQLATWLVGKSTGGVNVLDFHRLLAETSGQHAGMLRRNYRRLLPLDNHPNRAADEELAPKIADFVARATD